MDEYGYYRALREQRPYFGPHLRSLQGSTVRHAHMRAIAAFVARSVPGGRVNILEIGSWAGGSAITWARALEEHGVDGRVVCIDHWKRYLDADVNRAPVYREMTEAVDADRIYALFQHNVRSSGVGDRVIWIRADSRDILPHLAPRTFHIVFIDGSHRYEDVAVDLRNAEALVADGGILCGDDLELQSGDCDPKALLTESASGIDFAQDPKNHSFYHPGVTRAVAERLGQISAWQGFWAVCRGGASWTPVDLPEHSIEIPEHLREHDQPEVVREPLVVGTYNVLRAGDRYFAVSQALGEIDVLREPIGCRDLPPHLLIGNTLDDVRRRAEVLVAYETAPELVGEFDGYNLLRVGDRVCAVIQSLGPIALLRERIGERELPGILLLDHDADALKRRIRRAALDRSEQARALEERARAVEEARNRAVEDARARGVEEERARLRQEIDLREQRIAAFLAQQATDAAERLKVSRELQAAQLDARGARHDVQTAAQTVEHLHSELIDRGQQLEKLRRDFQCDLGAANQTIADLTIERDELYAFVERLQTELVAIKSRPAYRLATLWRCSQPTAPRS